MENQVSAPQNREKPRAHEEQHEHQGREGREGAVDAVVPMRRRRPVRVVLAALTGCAVLGGALPRPARPAGVVRVQAAVRLEG
ncbi:hypothetical protein ACWDTB_38215, partial [Streptomyces sp. NPDC003487]